MECLDHQPCRSIFTAVIERMVNVAGVVLLSLSDQDCSEVDLTDFPEARKNIKYSVSPYP